MRMDDAPIQPSLTLDMADGCDLLEVLNMRNQVRELERTVFGSEVSNR